MQVSEKKDQKCVILGDNYSCCLWTGARNSIWLVIVITIYSLMRLRQLFSLTIFKLKLAEKQVYLFIIIIYF